MIAGRVTPGSWGPRRVSLGLAMAVLSFVFTGGLLIALVVAFGSDYQLKDIGDSFAKAAAVAKYGDERLQAAASGKPLPKPPVILADQTTIRIGMITTLGYDGLIVLVAIAFSGLSPAGMFRKLRLNAYRVERLWVPGLIALGGYVVVIVYSVAAELSGIDFLIPDPTVPHEITRSPITFAVAALVAAVGAPFAEEFFFRGFIFTGLLRWGFWPAAAISATLFTLAHLDPGSMIPFFLIGIALAWAYWRRGSLWESIAVHVMFNSVSLFFLFLQR